MHLLFVHRSEGLCLYPAHTIHCNKTEIRFYILCLEKGLQPILICQQFLQRKLCSHTRSSYLLHAYQNNGTLLCRLLRAQGAHGASAKNESWYKWPFLVIQWLLFFSCFSCRTNLLYSIAHKIYISFWELWYLYNILHFLFSPKKEPSLGVQWYKNHLSGAVLKRQ